MNNNYNVKIIFYNGNIHVTTQMNMRITSLIQYKQRSAIAAAAAVAVADVIAVAVFI